MANIMDRFKNMGSAEVSSRRLPAPLPGKAAFLINSVRMHDNERKGGYRVEIKMTALWPVNNGKNEQGQECAPNSAGDQVSVCLFSGDYFDKSFKEFCLVACGITADKQMELCNALVPADPMPGASDLDRLNWMWNKTLPAMVFAVDPVTGAYTNKPGIFDGTRVVEVATIIKSMNKKLDPKGADAESNWVFDRTGNPVKTTFTNHYFNRYIPVAEVGEKLGAEGIKRFFGSVERFSQIQD